MTKILISYLSIFFFYIFRALLNNKYNKLRAERIKKLLHCGKKLLTIFSLYILLVYKKREAI